MPPTAARFQASFCDPFAPQVRELGQVAAADILPLFEQVPWHDLVQQVEAADPDTVYFSPSFGVENLDSRHGLSISAVEDTGEIEYYIFYRRPRTVPTRFGLSSKTDTGYLTEVQGQSFQQAVDCLSALLRNDLDYLERTVC